MPSVTAYDFDVIAWSLEQARLLRTGQFSLLDIEHIAEEIEDVGKSEQRELANRMAVLLAHLLKWQHQPDYRCNSWRRTVNEQRKSIGICIRKTPSLKTNLNDTEWWEIVWADAVTKASEETRLSNFPETCLWSIEQILDQDFWPE